MSDLITPADEYAMRIALDQAQNAWLAGEVDAAQLLMRAPEMLARKQIDLRTGTAVRAIDRVVQCVIEPGNTARGIAKGRMSCNVLDAFAVNPDLAVVLQAFDIALARHRARISGTLRRIGSPS